MQIVNPGHTYELDNVESGSQQLQFIEKEERDGELVTVTDGTTNEEVLAVLIDRVKVLDEKNPSDFNKTALAGLEQALEAFNARTADRKERGVEGTSAE